MRLALFVLAVALSLCVAGPAAAARINRAPQSGATCTMCGFLVNLVENWISSNTTEQELMAFLGKGCSYLGSFAEEVRYRFVFIFSLGPAHRFPNNSAPTSSTAKSLLSSRLFWRKNPLRLSVLVFAPTQPRPPCGATPSVPLASLLPKCSKRKRKEFRQQHLLHNVFLYSGRM